MPTPETLGAVPSFASVEDLQAGLAAKGQFACQSLYPRDGTEQLTETEARVSSFARVEPHEALLFTSGMAAVTAAIEVALNQSADKEPVLACPAQMYSQTTEYLRRYVEGSGVQLKYFKPDSTEHIEKVLMHNKPSVIVAETVGNEPKVSLLDANHLLSTVKSIENPPVVVLDNTLPLSTGLPLGEQLTADDRVLVVESGTKAYTANAELSGILYSKNPELLCAVRALRRAKGTMPGIGSVERIRSLLPETVEAFDARNRDLFRNTGRLAVWLQQAAEEGADFTVSHPDLQTHQNHLSGLSPVLFLKCGLDTDQFELTERLWRHPIVRKHADLGQSFGFDRTRILPDQQFPVVRIAGGAFTKANELGAALYDAALVK